MSNTSDNPPTGEDLSGRRLDDLGRDLAVLLERLAQNREAIAPPMAAMAGDDETVTEAARKEEATDYLEPRLFEPIGAPPTQLPSSLRRPGPPALELALIYREIAEKSLELAHEAGSGTVEERPVTSGPEAAAGVPWARPEGVGPSSPLAAVDSTDTSSPGLDAPHAPTIAGSSPRATRGRLLAMVPVAVGSIVLLATVVTLLLSLMNLL